MNVKRSSSSIAATASSSADGCSALNAAPSAFECREVREREDVPEARERGALSVDLLELRRVLAEHADRLRVREDVRHVLRRAVRVDPRADRSDLREREVEQRPFERRPRERRERVALATPRARRPFARFSTRSAASPQLTSCQWSPCWTRYAAPSRSLVTASRQSRAIVRLPSTGLIYSSWGVPQRQAEMIVAGHPIHVLGRAAPRSNAACCQTL